MKKEKKLEKEYHLYRTILAIVLLGVCVIYLYILTQKSMDLSEEGKHRVAVITKSTESSYWKNVFEGVNAACTEYNMEATILGPENEEDYEQQNEMVKNVVSSGVEAIIFSAVDYNENAKAVEEAVAAGVKVIVIDSDVNSDKVLCRISTDNYEAGRQVGEVVLSCHEEELHVGIVNFDENSENGQKRENGFRDYVKNEKRVKIVQSINVPSNIHTAKLSTLSMLKENPQINVVVTFNEWTSLGVGYAIRELGVKDETTVIAFDSNEVSIGMLEKGEVDALIVQNPYAMGYLSIEMAHRVLEGKSILQKEIDTTTTVVTKENMFDPQYQKVLFHFD